MACASLWAGLAVWHPRTTYHLAPAVVVLAGPVAGLADDRTRRPVQVALLAASLLVALATETALSAAGRLEGPALVGGSATWETLVVATVAGFLTAGATWWGTRAAGGPPS